MRTRVVERDVAATVQWEQRKVLFDIGDGDELALGTVLEDDAQGLNALVGARPLHARGA